MCYFNSTDFLMWLFLERSSLFLHIFFVLFASDNSLLISVNMHLTNVIFFPICVFTLTNSIYESSYPIGKSWLLIVGS